MQGREIASVYALVVLATVVRLIIHALQLKSLTFTICNHHSRFNSLRVRVRITIYPHDSVYLINASGHLVIQILYPSDMQSRGRYLEK